MSTYSARYPKPYYWKNVANTIMKEFNYNKKKAFKLVQSKPFKEFIMETVQRFHAKKDAENTSIYYDSVKTRVCKYISKTVSNHTIHAEFRRLRKLKRVELYNKIIKD
jgi:hypothetical protein